MNTSGAITPADILAAIEAMRDSRPRPQLRLVHPDTYRHRKGCPAWTNQPNPAHAHDARCWR